MRPGVLKDGDTFAVFDQHGDIQAKTGPDKRVFTMKALGSSHICFSSWGMPDRFCSIPPFRKTILASS
jgi:hypothetical protein